MVVVNFRTVQSKLYKVDLPANANISQAKEEVSKEIAGTDPLKMKLIYKSKILGNDVPISSLKLGEKDFIVVHAQIKKNPATPASTTESPESQQKADPLPVQASIPSVPELKPLPIQSSESQSGTSDLSKFEDSVQKLTDMGFDTKVVVDALRASGGNVDQAAELIITGEVGHDENEESDAQYSEDELENNHNDGPDEGRSLVSPEQAQVPPALTNLSPDQAAETLLVGLPQEDQDAIHRLQKLGNFNLLEVIQVYHACDKNEEMAANILFSNNFD